MNRVFARLLAGVLFAAAGTAWAADPPKPLPVAPATPARVLAASPADTAAAVTVCTPAGEPFAVVHTAFFRVPHDFAATAGLAADPWRTARQWSLSGREGKLLTALLLADKRCDLLSCPRLTLTDGQTGFFQVGQQYEVLGPLTVKEEKGEKVVTGKVTVAPATLALRLTPTIAADAGRLTAKAELQYAGVSGKSVAVPTVKADGSRSTDTLILASHRDLGSGDVAAAFDTHTLQTTLTLASGETVVVGGIKLPGQQTDGKPDELLLIVQTAVGRGTKK